MKQIYFCMVILMLLPVLSEAKLVNKPLNISIENCYSVDIYVDLEEGAETNIEFVGCKKIVPNEFHCDCLNEDNNNFSIVMRTDNIMVRDIRYYDIDISARYFDVYRKRLSVDVEDGGEYHEESQETWREMTDKNKRLIKIEYVNVNNTIYEDRIVEVVKEKIVYEERIVNNIVIEYVNKTEYVENTTRIEELEKELKNNNYVLIIISSGFLIILLITIYIIIKKNE